MAFDHAPWGRGIPCIFVIATGEGLKKDETGASYWLICQDVSLSLVKWNVWSSSYEV